MGKAPSSWVFAAFLGALTAAVYWPVASYPFIHFDDALYVTQNATVQKGLTLDGLYAIFTTPSPGGWPHPLALVSHMLDCQLYGLNAGGHHATNVFLHIAAAIFLFLALLGMTADPWRSSFVAAVFALHPLQVESVAWVAERKNVLNGFFFMLTLWLYARYAKRPSASRYASVAASFILSLLARSVMVSLPLVLLALDYWPLERRRPWRRLIVEKLPLLALSVACALIALQTAEAVSPLAALPFSARAANTVVSTASYVREAFWPSGLCVFSPYARGIAAWKSVSAGLLLLSFTGFCALETKRRPWLIVGWLWFLAALAPFSGLVQVGAQAMADRYMYLPLVGLALAAAWSAPASLGRQREVLLSAALVVALMVCSSLQLRYWQDGVSLFSRALALHPEGALVHSYLGAEFSNQGDFDDAVREFREGIALYPAHADARNNLALALILQGRLGEAEKELAAALEIDPESDGIRRNLVAVRRMRAEKKKGE